MHSREDYDLRMLATAMYLVSDDPDCVKITGSLGKIISRRLAHVPVRRGYRKDGSFSYYPNGLLQVKNVAMGVRIMDLPLPPYSPGEEAGRKQEGVEALLLRDLLSWNVVLHHQYHVARFGKARGARKPLMKTLLEDLAKVEQMIEKVQQENLNRALIHDLFNARVFDSVYRTFNRISYILRSSTYTWRMQEPNDSPYRSTVLGFAVPALGDRADSFLEYVKSLGIGTMDRSTRKENYRTYFLGESDSYYPMTAIEGISSCAFVRCNTDLLPSRMEYFRYDINCLGYFSALETTLTRTLTEVRSLRTRMDEVARICAGIENRQVRDALYHCGIFEEEHLPKGGEAGS